MPGAARDPLEDFLRDQTRGASYRTIAPPLSFEWRVSHPATPFSFGVPFPWQELEAADLITGSGNPPVLAIYAPRSDGSEASFALWVTADGVEVATADVTPLVGQIAQQAGRRVVGIRKVSLSGAPCRIILAPCNDGHLLEYLLVNAGNTLIEGRLVVPLAHWAGYLPHFETMLGTWAWER